MIEPAAPWVATGLVLFLLGPAVSWLRLPWGQDVATALGAVALSVGVYRLVVHADRAAGYRPPPGAGWARIRPEERARQSAACPAGARGGLAPLTAGVTAG